MEKCFVLSYVGLSDDQYGNGYNEVQVYSSLEKARAQLAAMRDAEIDNCVGMGVDCDTTQSSPDKCEISWSDGNQTVIITIFEKEIL